MPDTTRPNRESTSPWPILVAVGLVLSEVGILVGFLPLSVIGLVAFVGSIVGFAAESGHVSRPWLGLVAGGLVVLVVGLVMTGMGTGRLAVGPGASDSPPVGLATRGIAVVVAGALTVVLGIVKRYRE